MNRTPVFDVVRFVSGLPVPSRAFDVGRDLMMLPEQRWARYVTHVMKAWAAGEPEHDTAAAVHRILCAEVAA